MKYVMKDEGAEKRLNQIIGDFSSLLQKACKEQWGLNMENIVIKPMYSDYFICIPKKKIKQYAVEVDLKKWNKWPECEPIEVDDIMRLEVAVCENVEKYCAYFDGYNWIDWNTGKNISDRPGVTEIRFRPWDDE